MSSLTIDASAIIRLILPGRKDKESELDQLLLRGVRKSAPDFLKIEVSSVLSKFVRMDRLSTNEAKVAMAAFDSYPIRFVEFETIEFEAFQISTTYPVSYYDALYVATARFAKAPLITLDQKLYNFMEQSVLREYLYI